MKKRCLGIDFDDVTVDTAPVFLAFLNRHYGTDFSKDDLVEFGAGNIWGVTEAEISLRWLEFEQSQYHGDVELLHGAQEMIPRLACLYDLHLITNRPPSQRNSIDEILGRCLPNYFAEIHFCSRSDTLKTYRTKSAVCKHVGAHILFEDHPKNARQGAADGVHVCVFDQPWNRQHEFLWLAGIVVRVKHWRDPFLETLLS